MRHLVQSESLVPDASVPPSGTFDEDLNTLGDLLEDDVPAYVLVRLDDPPTEWLAVFYVPDSAKVRNKVCFQECSCPTLLWLLNCY